MKKIFYIGYYDIPENRAENRNIVLSATNKMSYIVKAFEKAGYSVNLISASGTRNPQKYNAKTVRIGEQSTLFLSKTLAWGNQLQRINSILYSKVHLIIDALMNIKDGDTVVVYHSVAYAPIIRWIRKKRNIKLVLEVEEIYSDVNGKKNERKKEFALFKIADAFIFPTELLNSKLNIKCKPYVIIHGTYQVENMLVQKNQYRTEMGWNNSKIHVVYAGTFDTRKGGALASIGAGEFLNSNYHLHIIGFGNEQDKKKVKEEVARVSDISGCKVSFDGLISGEDYIRYIQACDIGLCTQNPKLSFNDTSFPSKILSYMANGLRVVSVRVPVVEGALIGDYMYYYDEQAPQNIAEAIKSVDLTKQYDSRNMINMLDRDFVENLKKMLEGIKCV